MAGLSRLNFAHLRYFWAVAREGSITAAAKLLNVTQPTISTQIAQLERGLGTALFTRHGNRLELSEAGRLVQGYAAEIFALAETLEVAVKAERQEVGHRFAVGIVDSLPLLSAYRLLRPALEGGFDEVGKTDRLLASLASHSIDLVLSDAAAGPSSPVHVQDHLVCESGVSIFGTSDLAGTLRGPLPGAFDGAPFLLHTENTPLRRGLDTWFARMGIRPHVAAEVEDVALLQVLGRTGRGFFVAPSFVADEICKNYRVEVVATLDGVVERFFGLTLRDHPFAPPIRAVLKGG
jgi:LysR family transcriptional activator of nhaA